MSMEPNQPIHGELSHQGDIIRILWGSLMREEGEVDTVGCQTFSAEVITDVLLVQLFQSSLCTKSRNNNSKQCNQAIYVMMKCTCYIT